MFEDTTPEATARYLRWLRETPPAQKLERMARLVADGRALARAGLRARHPRADDAEIEVRLAALLYGREAASLLGPVPADAVGPVDVRLP